MEERKLTNAELIKALRWCGSEDERHEMCVDESYSCPLWNEDRMTDYCKADLMLAAADALEAQQVDLRKANEIIAEGIKVSRKSRAALEIAQKRISDLETALAACRARKVEQLPKEGEWMTNIRWYYQQPTQIVATTDGTTFMCRSTGKLCKNATEYGYCKQTVCNNSDALMKGEQE